MGNVSKSDELISVTAFGKYILNPMNEVTISSSSNDISYINTGIYVAGAEVEYRKQLLIPILTTLKNFRQD
jgi:fumarate hydratase class II